MDPFITRIQKKFTPKSLFKENRFVFANKEKTPQQAQNPEQQQANEKLRAIKGVISNAKIEKIEGKNKVTLEVKINGNTKVTRSFLATPTVINGINNATDAGRYIAIILNKVGKYVHSEHASEENYNKSQQALAKQYGLNTPTDRTEQAINPDIRIQLTREAEDARDSEGGGLTEEDATREAELEVNNTPQAQQNILFNRKYFTTNIVNEELLITQQATFQETQNENFQQTIENGLDNQQLITELKRWPKLSSNYRTTLPNNLKSNNIKLQFLDVHRLNTLPDDFDGSELEYLEAYSLKELPENAKFRNLKYASINLIKQLPEKTTFPNLEILNAPNLTTIPKNARFPKLKFLNAPNLTTIPENAQFPNLQVLNAPSLGLNPTPPQFPKSLKHITKQTNTIGHNQHKLNTSIFQNDTIEITFQVLSPPAAAEPAPAAPPAAATEAAPAAAEPAPAAAEPDAPPVAPAPAPPATPTPAPVAPPAAPKAATSPEHKLLKAASKKSNNLFSFNSEQKLIHIFTPDLDFATIPPIPYTYKTDNKTDNNTPTLTLTPSFQEAVTIQHPTAETIKGKLEEIKKNFLTPNIAEDGTLTDFDFTATVSDSFFQKAVHNDEQFEAEFDNLKYKTFYTHTLSTHFGVSEDNVPRIMREAIQIGWNDKFQFEDLLAVCPVNFDRDASSDPGMDGHSFQVQFKELHNKTPRTPEETAQYNYMKTLYEEGMKVVKLFNEEIHQQRQKIAEDQNDPIIQYENRLAQALKEIETQAQLDAGITKSDLVQHLQQLFQGNSTALAGEEITLRNQKSQEWVDQALAETSSETMAINLLDRRKVSVFKEDGTREELELFTMQEGKKEFNKQNVLGYYNHLITEGYKVQTNNPNSKYTTLLNNKNTILTTLPRTEQLQLMRKGYAKELAVQKAQQDIDFENLKNSKLAQNPQIKQIQEKLLEFGYPRQKIKIAEKKLLGAIGAGFENAKLKTVGGAVAYDLGENFGLFVDVSNQGVGTGFNLTGTIGNINEDGASLDLTGGARLDLGTVDVQPFAGARLNIQASDSKDIHLLFGFHLDPVSGAGYLAAAGFSHNQQRAQQTRLTEIKTNLNLNAIENASTNTKKIKLIRTHDQFRKFSANLSDADILAVYKTYNEELIRTSYDQSASLTPIESFAVGLKWGGATPHIVAGIGIRIGSRLVYKPTREARREIAKALQAEELQKLQNENSAPPAAQPTQQALTFTADLPADTIIIPASNLYHNNQGEVAVLDDTETIEQTLNLRARKELFNKVKTYTQASTAANKEETTLQSGLEKLKQQGLDLNITNINGQHSQAELTVNLTRHRNISVFVDPTSTFKIIPDKINNKLIITGDLSQLNILRQTFRYQRRIKEGGASAVDTIYITNKPLSQIKPEDFREKAATFAEKIWENNHETQWQTSVGLNLNGTPQVTDMEYEYADNNITSTPPPIVKPEETQQITAKLQRNIKIAQKLRGSLTTTTEAYNKFTIRENFEQISKTVFAQIKNDLENGSPRIDNIPGIITKANTREPFNTNPLNPKEVTAFIDTVQKNYFINIWEKGGKDKILKVAARNAEYSATKILYPKMLTAANQLNIINPEKVAKQLSQDIKDTVMKEFKAQIDKILKNAPKPNNITGEQLFNAIKKRAFDPNTLLAISTTVRKDKSPALHTTLATGKPQFITETGHIFNNDNDKDFIRIIEHLTNPLPTLSTEGLQSPLAKRLAAFPGTGMVLSEDDYKNVVEYYKDPTETKLQKHKASLEEFVQLAQAVRNGKHSNIRITSSEVGFAAYTVCSNLQIFQTEEFKMKVSIPGSTSTKSVKPSIHITATGNDIEVYEDTEKQGTGRKLHLGLSVTSSEKPSPQVGKKDHTEGPSSQPQPAKSPSEGPAAVNTTQGTRITTQNPGASLSR